MYIPKIEEMFEIIKSRSKILIFILILVLLFGFSLGSLSASFFGFSDDYQKTETVNSVGKIATVLAKPTELYKNKEFFKLNFFILLNNIRASIIHTVAGIIFIPTFFLILGQGTIIGLIFGILGQFLISVYTPVELVIIFFVFLLELTSLILASVEGIYLGISIFFPKKIFKKKIPRRKAFGKTIKQTMKIYIVIFILLFLGSVLETLVMFNLSKRNIEPLNIFQECGIVFDNVFENSPAEKVGLKSYSAIIKINDQKFSNFTEFSEMMNKYSPGDNIKLTNRRGEDYFLTLGTQPENLNINHGFIGISGVKTAWVKKGEC